MFRCDPDRLSVGVPINLPKTSAAEITEPQKPIVVSMNASGEYLHRRRQDRARRFENATRCPGRRPTRRRASSMSAATGLIEYGKLMDLLNLVNAAGFAESR